MTRIRPRSGAAGGLDELAGGDQLTHRVDGRAALPGQGAHATCTGLPSRLDTIFRCESVGIRSRAPDLPCSVAFVITEGDISSLALYNRTTEATWRCPATLLMVIQRDVLLTAKMHVSMRTPRTAHPKRHLRTVALAGFRLHLAICAHGGDIETGFLIVAPRAITCIAAETRTNLSGAVDALGDKSSALATRYLANHSGERAATPTCPSLIAPVKRVWQNLCTEQFHVIALNAAHRCPTRLALLPCQMMSPRAKEMLTCHSLARSPVNWRTTDCTRAGLSRFTVYPPPLKLAVTGSMILLVQATGIAMANFLMANLAVQNGTRPLHPPKLPEALRMIMPLTFRTLHGDEVAWMRTIRPSAANMQAPLRAPPCIRVSSTAKARFGSCRMKHRIAEKAWPIRKPERSIALLVRTDARAVGSHC